VTTLESRRGATITLGPVLGKGGEGTIYSVQNDDKLAVKLYLQGLARDRQEKVEKMSEAKLYALCTSVAYPIEPLLDSSGQFCGFTMLKMPGRKPAHELY
jgi:DNA-binding helix-hairpin-helix protein with protein kinase domain